MLSSYFLLYHNLMTIRITSINCCHSFGVLLKDNTHMSHEEETACILQSHTTIMSASSTVRSDSWCLWSVTCLSCLWRRCCLPVRMAHVTPRIRTMMDAIVIVAIHPFGNSGGTSVVDLMFDPSSSPVTCGSLSSSSSSTAGSDPVLLLELPASSSCCSGCWCTTTALISVTLTTVRRFFSLPVLSCPASVVLIPESLSATCPSTGLLCVSDFLYSIGDEDAVTTGRTGWPSSGMTCCGIRGESPDAASLNRTASAVVETTAARTRNRMRVIPERCFIMWMTEQEKRLEYTCTGVHPFTQESNHDISVQVISGLLHSCNCWKQDH